MGCWAEGAGVVVLPDGLRVRARGLRRPPPPGPDPEFALHLAARDPGPAGWPSRWVRWRDFGVPRDAADAVAALREVRARAAGDRVEVACGGGVGRTGTALAVLAVLSGLAADDAVPWVRAHHHPRAVETRGQRRWLAEVAAVL